MLMRGNDAYIQVPKMFDFYLIYAELGLTLCELDRTRLHVQSQVQQHIVP